MPLTLEKKQQIRQRVQQFAMSLKDQQGTGLRNGIDDIDVGDEWFGPINEPDPRAADDKDPVGRIADFEREQEQRLAAYVESQRKIWAADGDPDVMRVQCLDLPKLGAMTLREAAIRFHFVIPMFRQAIRKGWLYGGKRWVEEGKDWKPTMPTKVQGRPVVCVERPEWKFPSLKLAAAFLGVIPSAMSTAINSGERTGGFHWKHADTPVPTLMGTKTRNVLDIESGRSYANLARLVTELLHEDPQMLPLSWWNPDAVIERRRLIHNRVLRSIRSKGSGRRWVYAPEPKWKRGRDVPAMQEQMAA